MHGDMVSSDCISCSQCGIKYREKWKTFEPRVGENRVLSLTKLPTNLLLLLPNIFSVQSKCFSGYGYSMLHNTVHYHGIKTSVFLILASFCLWLNTTCTRFLQHMWFFSGITGRQTTKGRFPLRLF
jgi:hypothetical protein